MKYNKIVVRWTGENTEEDSLVDILNKLAKYGFTYMKIIVDKHEVEG